MSVETVENPVTVDTGDPTLAHIVNCPVGKESTAAWLTEARVLGVPVTALCGKTWVPSKDPKKYPICPECTDAAGIIMFDGGL